MYTKAKMLFCGYQLVSVSQYTISAVICVLDRKHSELGTGRGRGYFPVFL